MTETLILKAGSRRKIKCAPGEFHRLHTTKEKLQIFVHHEKIEIHIPSGFSYHTKPNQEYVIAAELGKDVELIHTSHKLADKSQTQN